MQSEKVIVGSFGSTLTREDAPLPEGALSGEARLRELEHLLKTATEVREQAEREMLNSTAAHEAARQRIAAAERMQRKAEQELVRLRTELAREQIRAGECWMPGDPLKEHRPPPASGADFEVAMLTGTANPRMGVATPAASRLTLSEEGGQRPAVATHRHPRPQAQPPARRRSGMRTFALTLIVIVGAGLGAAATFFAVQSPEVRQQIETLPERIKPLLGEPAAPAAEPQPAAAPAATPAAATPAPEAAVPQPDAEALAAQRRAWQAAVAAEELRLRRTAERDYARKLAALRGH